MKSRFRYFFLFLVCISVVLGGCDFMTSPFGNNDVSYEVSETELNRLLEFSLPVSVKQVKAQYSAYTGQGIDLNLRLKFALPLADLPSFQETLQALSRAPIRFREGYSGLIDMDSKGMLWWTPVTSVRFFGESFTSKSGKNYKVMIALDDPVYIIVYLEGWW